MGFPGDAAAGIDPGGGLLIGGGGQGRLPPDSSWLILQRLEDLRGAQASLETRLDSGLKAVDAKIGAIDAKIGAMESKMDAKFETMDSKLEGLRRSNADTVKWCVATILATGVALAAIILR